MNLPGRYDITPLDTSTRAKLLAQMNQVGDSMLSQADIDALLSRYGTMEDQGLRQAQDAATMELSQQYSPAFEAIRARNYGLYSGGGAQRDYSREMGQAMTGLTTQRMGLGAESAARKAAYLRSLAEQRMNNKANLGNQLYGRMLTTKKTPSTGQRIGAGLGQVGGAVAGALLGGPAGAAVSALGTFASGYQNEIANANANGIPTPAFRPGPVPPVPQAQPSWGYMQAPKLRY